MTITAHDGLSMTMEILSNYGIKLSITKRMKKTRTILTLMVLVNSYPKLSLLKIV